MGGEIYHEVWLFDLDGKSPTFVTTVPSRGSAVRMPTPTFGPEAKRIYFLRDSSDNKTQFVSVARDGTDATQLWSGSGFIPDLSPDGRYAAFASAVQANNTLFVVDIESGELITFQTEVPRPTDGLGTALGRPRWFDGGRVLAYTGAEGNRIGVFAQDFVPDRDTTATRRPLAGFDPEWDTESFDVTPDGSVVILSRVRPGGTVMLAENVPFVEGRAGR